MLTFVPQVNEWLWEGLLSQDLPVTQGESSVPLWELRSHLLKETMELQRFPDHHLAWKWPGPKSGEEGGGRPKQTLIPLVFPLRS